ncbi:MAG: TIGR01212 family radical SAM protein [Mariprofundaceae bacterium]|nr:TIGR01212 family radical SAM protein [Mariprofundaceae bacterium]
MPGPIYSFGDYLKQRFTEKVHKVTVNADFTCPNIDGTRGRGGCIYCNNVSFNPNSRRKEPDIAAQIEAGRKIVRKRTGATKVLAYFQAYSNTYAPVENLRFLYEQALQCPDVVGLVIGTRPDCVSEEVLELLVTYQQRGYEIWLEYGLQSAHDKTLQRINRGHSFAEYHDTVIATRERGLSVCTHLILGLPGEDRAMMLETLARVRETGTDGIKLHPLHVVRRTMLAHEWRKGNIQLLSQSEYVSLACDMLERMPASWAVHRLTGTASEDVLLAPEWCVRKWVVINAIYAEMHRRGCRQGSALQEAGHVAIAHDPGRCPEMAVAGKRYY